MKTPISYPSSLSYLDAQAPAEPFVQRAEMKDLTPMEERSRKDSPLQRGEHLGERLLKAAPGQIRRTYLEQIQY